MATVQVRYIVHDVDDAIAFYCGFLGFQGGHAPRASLRHAEQGRPSSRSQRAQPRGRRWTVDTRRQKARAWRLESVRDRGRGHRGNRREAAERRGEVQEQYRNGRRRETDHRRGPVGQPGRAVPADHRGSKVGRLVSRSILTARIRLWREDWNEGCDLCATVLYPYEDGGKFDFDYYAKTLAPNTRQCSWQQLCEVRGQEKVGDPWGARASFLVHRKLLGRVEGAVRGLAQRSTNEGCHGQDRLLHRHRAAAAV